MEDYEQNVVYNILVDKKIEKDINKILDCITIKDFPALKTFKDYLGKLVSNKHIYNTENIKNIKARELKYIEQILEIYKKRIIICYIFNLLNNSTINDNTPIQEIIEYLQEVAYNNEFLDLLKKDALKKIAHASGDEIKKLGMEYKRLDSKKIKLDYNRIVPLFSININSISNNLKNNFEINIKIDEDIESPLIRKSLESLNNYKNKNVTINTNQKHEKKLEKKL